ncbi:phage tail protein [Latilactobacillus curvatus]|uniref:phage tail protein n=1 Tax=Latilactobacillus curvatus TaxID=28038 RepID=UPI00084A06C9|nr:phage tail protein [Latilactobacillus curvatus]AOO75962.1 phage tail protein [Latilactobacillus curvatus]
MAIVGLKMVRIAQVDPLTQAIVPKEKSVLGTDVLEIDETFFGTKTANITGIEGTLTKVYGNNVQMDAMVGGSAPAIALDVNNLGFGISQGLVGRLSDGKGGFVSDGSKPHFAVSVESQTLDRKESVFFNFGNGLFTAPTQNIGTDTENQTRQGDNLTFTALSTKAFNKEPFKPYFTGDEGFDMANMYKETFGGFKLDTGTVTPPEGGGNK